jgi:homoisocitrate dehydrogenase
MPKLCVIDGDGIGKEVVPVAVSILQKAIPSLETVSAEAGWECFLRKGVSVPAETLQAVRDCGSALFGAVSSPSQKVDGYRSAIVTLRQELDLYANLRPVRSLPRVSPVVGVDLLIVRENTEGLYIGRERIEAETAIAERVITRQAALRIARRALELAVQNRMPQVTIVHKANILPLTDGMFRDAVRETAVQMDIAAQGVAVDEMLVDTAAYQLISNPQRFSVIVTTNLFGDILSDEAAHWCGGMGMAASLNWGDSVAVAEPVHGSAPDIAGSNTANPIAAILSGALLARYAWGLTEAAQKIERAVQAALLRLPVNNYRLASDVSTAEVAGAVLAGLD